MSGPTLVSAWSALRRRFEAVGLPTPIIDARLLLEAAAEASRLDLITDPHRALTEEARARLEAFARRREAHEPVAYILGRREFFGLDLLVDPSVLIPRPDTEALVYAGLKALSGREAPVILDLGTGSGAILLAFLANRPDATGVGVDLSPAALACADHNASRLGLRDRVCLLAGDFTDAVEGRFDLVVSNPPYVVRDEIPALSREVAGYEPALALDGGADGLDFYRRLARDLPRLLKAEARFFVEIGAGAEHAVAAILEAGGALSVDAAWPDLSGRTRVLGGGPI